MNGYSDDDCKNCGFEPFCEEGDRERCWYAKPQEKLDDHVYEIDKTGFKAIRVKVTFDPVKPPEPESSSNP